MPKIPVSLRIPIDGLALWGFMPVVRYFIFVGSALFVLLLAADRYLPGPADRSAAIDVDRSIIRIRSARMLPEKIVFDTANPLVAAASALAVNEQREDPRQALAMMPQSQAAQPAPPPSGRIVKRRTSRPHLSFRKPVERRVALDHESFGGW